jgi:hypothetical protein
VESIVAGNWRAGVLQQLGEMDVGSPRAAVDSLHIYLSPWVRRMQAVGFESLEAWSQRKLASGSPDHNWGVVLPITGIIRCRNHPSTTCRRD